MGGTMKNTNLYVFGIMAFLFVCLAQAEEPANTMTAPNTPAPAEEQPMAPASTTVPTASVEASAPAAAAPAPTAAVEPTPAPAVTASATEATNTASVASPAPGPASVPESSPEAKPVIRKSGKKNGLHTVKLSCEYFDNPEGKKIGKLKLKRELWTDDHSADWYKVYRKEGPAFAKKECFE